MGMAVGIVGTAANPQKPHISSNLNTLILIINI